MVIPGIAKLLFEKHLKGDRAIWFIAFFLTGIGGLAVYSSVGSLAFRNAGFNEFYYFARHFSLAIFGLVVMYGVHRMPYRIFKAFSVIGIWLSILLLTYAVFFGTQINDANRWVTIPVIGNQFQPSDLAKLALISYVARILSANQNIINRIPNTNDLVKVYLPLGFFSAVIIGLIALSNMSTAIMLSGNVVLLLLVGRVPFRLIALVGLFAGLVLFVAFFTGQRGGTALNRIKSFVYQDEVPFQRQQGYLAIANGGGSIFGLGPGNSRQKDIIPHPYSDFIYAIILEEYGIVGGVTVAFMYIWLLMRGLKAVQRSENPFGGLLSAGLTMSLVIQALVHMGVVTGIGPITGQTLPFVSMGGTSLLFTGAAFGIIISVSRGDQTDTTGGAKRNYSAGGNTFRN